MNGYQILLIAFLVVLPNIFYYGLGHQKGFKDGVGFVVKIGQAYNTNDATDQIKNITKMEAN